MKARDRVAVDALRTALAAIDNAGAVEASRAPIASAGPIAGAAAGVGATEATRLALSEDDVESLVEGIADDLHVHATEHERAGRPDDAAALGQQAHILEQYLAVQRHPEVAEHLESYVQRADLDDDPRVLRQLVRLAATRDPWSRDAAVHFTGSALVVDPARRTVLLRWHARQQGWLQVGGHVDPGEEDPFQTANREAQEETGLTDLEPWPDPQRPELLQAVVVPVPAGKGEPPHHHADLRFVLATRARRHGTRGIAGRARALDDARRGARGDRRGQLRIALDRLDELLDVSGRGGLVGPSGRC